jgi:hypothetical protein
MSFYSTDLILFNWFYLYVYWWIFGFKSIYLGLEFGLDWFYIVLGKFDLNYSGFPNENLALTCWPTWVNGLD